MWGVTQFSSSTLSPIRSYAESSPPRHRMVVSKKEMLFILWKLSEVRTCHMHGNGHSRCDDAVCGVWGVSRAREVRTHGNGGRDERMRREVCGTCDSCAPRRARARARR